MTMGLCNYLLLNGTSRCKNQSVTPSGRCNIVRHNAPSKQSDPDICDVFFGPKLDRMIHRHRYYLTTSTMKDGTYNVEDIRSKLAFIDDNGRTTNDTGEAILIDNIHVKPTTFSKKKGMKESYVLHLEKGWCTCPARKFNKQIPFCKHLAKFVQTPTLVTYTQRTIPFRLISNTIPSSTKTPWVTWLASIKYDGIRISIQYPYGTTRGGAKVDLSSILPAKSFDKEWVVDAELYLPGGTHDDVLSRMNTGHVGGLTVRVFDSIPSNTEEDTLGFAKRVQLLQDRLPGTFLVTHQPAWTFVRQVEPAIDEFETVSTEIIRWVHDQQPIQEGLVIRNPTSAYFGADGKKRDNRIAFKIK